MSECKLDLLQGTAVASAAGFFPASSIDPMIALRNN